MDRFTISKQLLEILYGQIIDDWSSDNQNHEPDYLKLKNDYISARIKEIEDLYER